MTTPHEDDYPVSVVGRMSFTAPSVELAKALETIAPIPDAKSAAGFDAVRIEATDGGAVVVSAANPLMMARPWCRTPTSSVRAAWRCR